MKAHVGPVLGAACVTGLLASAASAASPITITNLKPEVVQGSLQTLSARVNRPAKTCTLSVRYADGGSQGLGAHRVLRKSVGWTWKTPATASPGTATVRVLCLGVGSAQGTFRITKRSVPAQVVVAKTGFTQVVHDYDSGTTISYGLVLVNRSPDETATFVQVAVNLLDTSNRAMGTDTSYVKAIPAGATFYLAGEVRTRDRTTVAGLEPVVQFSTDTAAVRTNPVVTDVHVIADQYTGDALVDGQVTNEGTCNLSSGAMISAVLFDSAGNIIGGAFDFPPLDLPPGARTAFEARSAVPATSVASVQLSVEPECSP